jgi:hypothetical protein
MPLRCARLAAFASPGTSVDIDVIAVADTGPIARPDVDVIAVVAVDMIAVAAFEPIAGPDVDVIAVASVDPISNPEP